LELGHGGDGYVVKLGQSAKRVVVNRVCQTVLYADLRLSNVVRHRRERQHFGQMAAAIRTALPATASADPEPLTNGL